ncbi:unnamed protein product [Ectocarpus fasciculatus]
MACTVVCIHEERVRADTSARSFFTGCFSSCECRVSMCSCSDFTALSDFPKRSAYAIAHRMVLQTCSCGGVETMEFHRCSIKLCGQVPWGRVHRPLYG